jgi:DNA repair protein RadA/Sms
MAKLKAQFVCRECGTITSKWSGKCNNCGEWDTIIEDVGNSRFSKAGGDKAGKVIELTALNGSSEMPPRSLTGMSELDRVLGGGLVAGSAILIGGDPGIGKSTMLLQLSANMAKNKLKSLYITGEESAEQVRMRAKRLNVQDTPVLLAAATSVTDILATIKKHKPDVVVIDSIQTVFLDTVESAPGTVSQVRICAHELISLAKKSNTAVILVGHVTKEGQIAGPKILEHMVDTVLYFEGDRGHQFRILRSVKNRFGAANEIGVFEMTGDGLKEILNPSALFVSGKAGEVSGSVVYAGMEGTRPVMVEIQALVAPTQNANPRRAVVGWDSNRLAMILAVLETRAGVKLADKEVYLNVAGGMKINEPGADIAVAAAIVSALTNIPIQPGGVIFGEIGLSGEVRAVGQAAARLKEAEKLGFKSAIVPPDAKPESKSFICKEIKYITQIKNFLAQD